MHENQEQVEFTPQCQVKVFALKEHCTDNGTIQSLIKSYGAL